MEARSPKHHEGQCKDLGFEKEDPLKDSVQRRDRN
jgi:hypothetical protein